MTSTFGPLMPFDSALAESTIGLFKTEAIRDDGPFRDGPLKTIEDVEWTTLSWVDWSRQPQAPLHARPAPADRVRKQPLR